MLIAHLNVRSLTNNFHLFRDYFCDFRCDVLALTETWLKPSLDYGAIELDGYHLIRKDRVAGRGGGICFYVSTNIKFKHISLNIIYDSFEYSILILQFSSKSVLLCCVYRPSSLKNYNVFF